MSDYSFDLAVNLDDFCAKVRNKQKSEVFTVKTGNITKRICVDELMANKNVISKNGDSVDKTINEKGFFKVNSATVSSLKKTDENETSYKNNEVNDELMTTKNISENNNGYPLDKTMVESGIFMESFNSDSDMINTEVQTKNSEAFSCSSSDSLKSATRERTKLCSEMQPADEKKGVNVEEKFVSTVYVNISTGKLQDKKKLETGSSFSTIDNIKKSAFNKYSRDYGSTKVLNDVKLKNKVSRNGTTNNIINSDTSKPTDSLKSKCFKSTKLVDLLNYFEEAKPCSTSTNVVKDLHKPTARFDVKTQRKCKAIVDEKNQLTSKLDDASQFKTIFGVKLRKTARINNGEFLGSVINRIDSQARSSVDRFGVKVKKGPTVSNRCKNLKEKYSNSNKDSD